jgi:hypothetical protein
MYISSRLRLQSEGADFPTAAQAKNFSFAGEDNFLCYAGSIRSPDA